MAEVFSQGSQNFTLRVQRYIRIFFQKWGNLHRYGKLSKTLSIFWRNWFRRVINFALYVSRGTFWRVFFVLKQEFFRILVELFCRVVEIASYVSRERLLRKTFFERVFSAFITCGGWTSNIQTFRKTISAGF